MSIDFAPVSETQASVLMHFRSNVGDKNTRLGANGTYHFTLPNPLKCREGFAPYVSLHTANIPNSFYNVNQNNNYFELIQDNDGSVTTTNITLDMGNYTAEFGTMPLLQEIENKINAIQNKTAFDDFTVTFSNTTGKFRFSAQGPRRSLQPKSVTLKFPADGSTHTLLGFDKGASALIDDHNTVTSTNVVDLSGGNHNLIIQSMVFSDAGSILCGDMGFQQSTSSFFIPINAPNYGMINYTAGPDEFRIAVNDNLQDIDMRITNQAMQLLDFNGIHWNITLRFDFVRIYEAHPIRQMLNDRSQKDLYDQQTSSELARMQQNMARIHEVLPVLREHVIRQAGDFIQAQEQQTLTTDSILK